jgi:excisionase family DNA binding protein
VSVYPPPYQDAKTLARNLCCSVSTIWKWVHEGHLPAPRRIGGKTMWRWEDVDNCLTGRQGTPDDLANRIRDATRQAARAYQGRDVR